MGKEIFVLSLSFYCHIENKTILVGPYSCYVAKASSQKYFVRIENKLTNLLVLVLIQIAPNINIETSQDNFFSSNLSILFLRTVSIFGNYNDNLLE